MTTIIFSISCFLIGLATGVAVVRYGFGLGVKSVQRIKDDLPLIGHDEPIEQESVFDMEEE